MVQMRRSPNGWAVRPHCLGLIPLVTVLGALALVLAASGSASPLASAARQEPAGILAASSGCAPTLALTLTADSAPMGMAYDAATGRLFVANASGPGDGSLLIVFLQHRIYLPVVMNAWSGPLAGAASDAGGQAQVAAAQAGAWPVTQVITGLAGARSVAYDATRNRIYVGGGNTIWLVDGADHALLGTFTLSHSTSIFDLAYNPSSDTVYVTDYGNNKVKLIDAAQWGTATDLNTSDYALLEPAHIAVNAGTNKVYVSNHHGGTGPSWVTVINGVTNQIETNVFVGGDLYGIAVDTAHNRIYATAISEARIYAIDGASNTWLGDIQIRRASDDTKVPLRMVGVNPTIGSNTHVWVTSAEADKDKDRAGMDKLIVLSFDSATGWPPAVPSPRAMDIGAVSFDGLAVDPAFGRVIVSSTGSNLVIVAQDGASLCPTPLAASGDELMAVVETR